MNIKCKWKGREDESSSFWWKMILIAVGRLKYENVNLISSEKKVSACVSVTKSVVNVVALKDY